MAKIQITVFTMLAAQLFLAADEPKRTMRYLRPAGSEHRLETEIILKQSAAGHSISSVTHRGKTQLSLASTFDGNGRLQDAKVTIIAEGGRQTAKAHFENGKVSVRQPSGRITVLDCPSGIIVTSAPDWTDAIMLMRRYDEKKGGVQRLDGLWIHPTRPPLRLTFEVSQEATETIKLNGQSRRLERFSIVLRNESRYVAWRNGERELVRLVAKGQTRPAIVLEGWEEATRRLMPNRR